MTAPKTTEASIQATLKHALETCGYIVLEVAKGRSAKAKGLWTGTTPGTPDIFVSHEQWPVGEWLGLELKTPTGRVRPEQQRLAGMGRVVIVRGVYEGLDAVVGHEVKICHQDKDKEQTASVSRGVKLAAVAGQFREVSDGAG